MPITLAFDVYGTLIDTSGVFKSLKKLVGDKAGVFTDLWRTKQLEYAYRRGLMQNYRDFSVCTRQALDYTCLALEVQLTAADRTALMETYRFLPAYPDVVEGLEKLKVSAYHLYAFSNGRPDDVRNLLEHAGIAGFFEGVVSTDEVRSFKPNPAVYAHFLRRAEATGAEAWLVSGNPFDVIGAISAGLNGVWVKRSEQAVFDPWEIEPTVTVANFAELFDVLSR